MAFQSLTEAIESAEARHEPPDLSNQAKYYLECMLSRFHCVEFGPSDTIEDRRFEHNPVLRELETEYEELEKMRIADPVRGRLDRFG